MLPLTFVALSVPVPVLKIDRAHYLPVLEASGRTYELATVRMNTEQSSEIFDRLAAPALRSGRPKIRHRSRF